MGKEPIEHLTYDNSMGLANHLRFKPFMRGKTIEDVRALGDNDILLYFTDGTKMSFRGTVIEHPRGNTVGELGVRGFISIITTPKSRMNKPLYEKVEPPHDSPLDLTDDELSALIRACKDSDRVNPAPRPLWDARGKEAQRKLIAEEKRRSSTRSE